MANETKTLDAVGENFIKCAEDAGGKPRLAAYDDGTGTWTGPWGITHGVKEGQQFTIGEAQQLFDAEIGALETEMRKVITREVSQGLWDAFESFGYNNGLGKCGTLINAINSGEEARIRAAWMLFVHAYNEETGRMEVWPGLVHRRQNELALWYKIDHDANQPISEPQVPLPLPNGPAQMPPKPNIVTTAAGSRSVWAHITGALVFIATYVTHLLNTGIDQVAHFATALPSVDDVQTHISTAQQVAGWFHINAENIGATIVIGAFAYALIRRALDKQEQVL